MKEYTIPITWEVYDEIKVKATSMEAAVKIVEGDTFSLPTSPEYVDGSFRIDGDMLDELSKGDR